VQRDDWHSSDPAAVAGVYQKLFGAVAVGSRRTRTRIGPSIDRRTNCRPLTNSPMVMIQPDTGFRAVT
jgi:hypothetical protein